MTLNAADAVRFLLTRQWSQLDHYLLARMETEFSKLCSSPPIFGPRPAIPPRPQWFITRPQKASTSTPPETIFRYRTVCEVVVTNEWSFDHSKISSDSTRKTT